MMFRWVLLAGLPLLPLLLAPPGSEAAPPCKFTAVGFTMTLEDNCTTNTTIVVPNGVTLDGDGKTITAVDPPSGHFVGAVVANGGPFGAVKNLMIDTDLANECDTDSTTRLRGILLDGASGTIRDNTVANVHRAGGSCSEGAGIEIRNAPFDNTGTDAVVLIAGNTVTNYQKTGILVSGSVAATIAGNTVIGAGRVSHIVQNGIQIGFGATAIVQDNGISENYYTPKAVTACGLILFQADGVTVSRNRYSRNEQNVCNLSRGGGQFNPQP